MFSMSIFPCKLSGSLPLARLKKPHFDRICSSLDATTVSTIPRWNYILESYYKKNREIGRQKALELNLAYRGGGNPGLVFLGLLETRIPDLTLKRFRDVAKIKYIQRNDIASSEILKDKENHSGLLLDLTADDKASLAALLNTRRGIPGWEYFADEFDFPNSLKKTIELSVKSEGQTSPSEHMLKNIFTGMTTDELKKLCSDNGFHFVCNEITSIEKELEKKSKPNS